MVFIIIGQLLIMKHVFVVFSIAYLIISLIYLYKMNKYWNHETKGDITNPMFSMAYFIIFGTYFYRALTEE